MPILAAALLGMLLLCAAWRDVATRTIPDTAGLLVAILGLAARLSEGIGAAALSLTLAAGLVLLMLPLHARGMIGGGDVKLAAALLVGLSPLAGYRFVVATALAGGLLALLYLALSRLLPERPAGAGGTAVRRVLRAEGWRIRRHGPLPYGVAIGLGWCAAVLQAGEG
ncbi:prepilin peptidase [Roseomonas elaeocarpi]|uniref:Prepilin peptidase n=1 Tax=Roseomonas elaeocarpi TaxID=907779 RepID=A0ABV6JSH7_9PROT